MAFVVAIDGPAASGKGVISRRLGASLGLPVLDTGLLYRAVGAAVLRIGGDLDDEKTSAAAAGALDLRQLEDPGLRSERAGEAASRVAVHLDVRRALLEFQRAFAMREPGAVLDGRDIGTVIFPEAQAKFFVTASVEARAQRRWRQLSGQGEAVTYDDTLADIRRRDARDAAREAAPMRPSPDAVLLDTTDLDIDGAFDAARRIVEAARGRWERSQSGQSHRARPGKPRAPQ
jgi:cytidylate kinase